MIKGILNCLLRLQYCDSMQCGQLEGRLPTEPDFTNLEVIGSGFKYLLTEDGEEKEFSCNRNFDVDDT